MHKIRAAMEQAKMKRDEALAYIVRVDEDRSRWARLLYGVDWTDPTQYGAVLNLSQMSVAGACETIGRMTELEEFRPTPDGQKRFDDLRLSSRVWAALSQSPETRSAGIQVTADGGEVLIRGSVGSAKALESISRIAGAVDGVKSLRCEAGLGTDWYW